MDLIGISEDFVSSLFSLASGSPVIAVIALIILAFLIYRRPKLFLLIFLLGTILIGVLYVVSGFSTSGSAKKGGLIEKSVTTDESFKTPLPQM